MRIEDVKIGMTVTVRPAVRGVARFDAVVKSNSGNFIKVQRLQKCGLGGGDEWVVGLHEISPHDGLTDFQRKILTAVRRVKSTTIENLIQEIDTFKSAEPPREAGAQEAAVMRAVKKHPLSNYVEAKRAEGNNRKERFWVLTLK
jgi:hypothetical protein